MAGAWSGDGACFCCFVREEKEDKNVKNSWKNKNKKRGKSDQAKRANNKPGLLASWWLLDYFLTALVIAWLSGIQWAVMCCLMDKTGK